MSTRSILTNFQIFFIHKKYYILFIDQSQGIFITWINDYNKNYSCASVTSGIDIELDLTKRRNYCCENNIQFDEMTFQYPIWTQSSAVSNDSSFNAHFGARELPTYQEIMESGQQMNCDLPPPTYDEAIEISNHI